MGGTHATLNPEEVELHCDSVLCGLADDIVPELINDFLKTGKLKKRYTQKSDMSFKNMALPQRDIYERKSIWADELNMVQATFGCSNTCKFCVQPYVCEGYHQRPVDDVIEEIKLIKDNYIEFVDPNLSKDLNYLRELCVKISPLKKKWFAPMAISVCNDDITLGLLSKSGCCEILIGFESVNQNSVKDINKGFNNVEKYKECIKKLHSYGIKVTGSFVLGLDSDDNKMDANGRIVERDWSLYDCAHCVIKPANMTQDDVEAGYNYLWKQAYSLKNILKRLNYIKSPFERLQMIIKNYVFGVVYCKMIFKDRDFVKNTKMYKV